MNATDTKQRNAEALVLMQRVVTQVKVYLTFYGALLERLKLKIDTRHPTMYTDAVVIGFSPEFVLSQRFEHLVYIVVHEVTHCALEHPFRRGQRDAKLWNIACDHVVNLALNADAELCSMFPGNGLADEKFKGMAAEQVYAALLKEQPPQPDGGSDDEQELEGASGMPGDCCDAGASGEPLPESTSGDGEADDDGDGDDSDDDGEHSDDEHDDDGEADEHEQDVAVNAEQAAVNELQREWAQATMTAQLACGGEVESALARAIANTQIERKDFRQYVDEFAYQTCSMEDSWSRSNRRYSDTYLPSRCAPGVKVMVVAVDTSGSVSAQDLAEMQQAAQGVLEDFGLKEMHVVYCDTQIRGIEVFRPGEEVKLTVRGGGGTRFHPPLRYALELQQQGEDVAGVVYLTDLMGDVRDPEDFAQLQVLWVDVTQYGAKRYRDPPSGVGRVVSVYA